MGKDHWLKNSALSSTEQPRLKNEERTSGDIGFALV